MENQDLKLLEITKELKKISINYIEDTFLDTTFEKPCLREIAIKKENGWILIVKISKNKYDLTFGTMFGKVFVGKKFILANSKHQCISEILRWYYEY